MEFINLLQLNKATYVDTQCLLNSQLVYCAVNVLYRYTQDEMYNFVFHESERMWGANRTHDGIMVLYKYFGSRN